MGMTIDEILDVISNYNCFECGFGDKGSMPKCNCGIDSCELKRAMQYVCKILRNYKQIEEIVKFCNANELGFEYVGEKITEVMEDA